MTTTTLARLIRLAVRNAEFIGNQGVPYDPGAPPLGGKLASWAVCPPAITETPAQREEFLRDLLDEGCLPAVARLERRMARTRYFSAMTDGRVVEITGCWYPGGPEPQPRRLTADEERAVRDAEEGRTCVRSFGEYHGRACVVLVEGRPVGVFTPGMVYSTYPSPVYAPEGCWLADALIDVLALPHIAAMLAALDSGDDSVLPILADALDEAGDSRANGLRSFMAGVGLPPSLSSAGWEVPGGEDVVYPTRSAAYLALALALVEDQP